MKLPKKAFTKKLIILFVSLAFVLQPVFVLAQSVGSAEDPVVTSESTSEDGTGQGDIVIETGDVVVEIVLDNDVNQNSSGSIDSDLEEPALDSSSVEPVPATEETSEEASSSPDQILVLPAPETASSGDELLSSENGIEISTSTNDVLANDNNFDGKNVFGADGSSGENASGETDGEVIIDTGDIKVTVEVNNNINNNDLDILCVDCEEDDASSSVFDISNQNDSNLDNELGISATSGDNYIDESDGALIKTGDIGIVSMIINFVNTNFIGSGKEFLINVYNKMAGSIDLSGYSDSSTNSEQEGEIEKNFDPCDGPDCQLNIDNDSTSTINNLINIDVTTGSNVVATTTDGGIIETGDIDIVNDIINIANLNVSGNDYFFAVVNIFGEMDGDVILPAAKQSVEDGGVATSVPEKIFDAELSSEFVISNQNDAGLSNNLNINANTGDNETGGDSDSLIVTGDIESQIKTLNLINYNISGDFWKFARINIFGSWKGIINGLPEEYSYYEDENGITVYNKFLDNPALNEAYAQLAIDNYNIASTTNEININASTGDNSILHHEEPSLIKTGYIKIKNSLLNFLNSNFSGNNWEFSMINVFGDWKGNLDFGQPELWLNVSVSEKETAEKGDYVTYTFIYGNNGDSTATNVIVVDDFNEDTLHVVEPAGGEEGDGFVAWNLGDIPPNSQGSFSYTTQVGDIPTGRHVVENSSNISSKETDRDTSNNSSFASFFVSGGISASGFSTVSTSKSSMPSLSIVKTNNATEIVHPGDVIDYDLLIRNNGSRDAQEVYVLDVMSNLDTEVEIHRDFWNLGTVFAGEEILIEYSLEISSEIKSGTYINEATIEGYDSNRQVYISAIGSSRNKIVNNVIKATEPNIVFNRISKSSFVNPGDLVDFEIIIANNGEKDAIGIEITEILPDYLTYVDSGDSIGSWKFDIIESGEIKNIKYSVAVSEEAKEGIYETYISLVGDNIDNGSLIDTTEVKEVEVLGEKLFLQEKKTREGNMDLPPLISSAKVPVESYKEQTASGTEISESEIENDIGGQVLGVDESSDSGSKYYMLYLWIVFLIILLILAMFLFFMEGRDNRENIA